MPVTISYRGRNISVAVKEVSSLGKYIGLMFKSSGTASLLFDFGRPGRHAIHSYFVFFKFLAVWTDGKNRVVDASVVNPFTFLVRPSRDAVKLIEIPCSTANRKIIHFFVGKGKV